VDYVLFTLAMINHELAERMALESRSDIENRDEEHRRIAVNAEPGRYAAAASPGKKP